MYDQTRAQQPADRPPDPAGRHAQGPEPLLPSDERDRIVRRLGHAVNAFTDAPREALEEAENAFDEATEALLNALAARRRVLRAGFGRTGTPRRSPPNYGSRYGSTGRSPGGCCAPEQMPRAPGRRARRLITRPPAGRGCTRPTTTLSPSRGRSPGGPPRPRPLVSVHRSAEHQESAGSEMRRLAGVGHRQRQPQDSSASSMSAWSRSTIVTPIAAA